MALFVELRPGEAFRIGNSVVSIEHKSGPRVRLKIDSQDDIQTYRDGQTPPRPTRRLPVAPRAESSTPALPTLHRNAVKA